MRLYLARFLFFVFLCNLCFSHRTNRSGNQLSGKHLVVAGLNSIAGLNVIRNSTGHVVKIGGMAARMLEWQSECYNFTYSILQVNDTSLDPTGDQKGLIAYLMEDECQVLISVVVTRARIALIEFSQPSLYVPVSYLIPKAGPSVKITSIANPFDQMVWLAIFVSINVVVLAMYLIQKLIPPGYSFNKLKLAEKKSYQQTVSSHAISVLLNQGSHLHFNWLPLYIVGGVWCLAAFVLVNAYTTTLISYLTLPNDKLMIDSIYDFRNRTDIYLVTDRNLNTDAVLSGAETGFLRILGDRLRSYPKSRCNSTKECVALVKSGSHVYSSGITSFLSAAVKEDFKTTGQCNLYLKPESYLSLQATWAVQKQKSFLLRKSLDVGIMRMREAGLLDKWTSEATPNATRCLVKDKKHKTQRLSLNNLSGAFVILLAGTTFAFFVFIGEHIIFANTKRRGF